MGESLFDRTASRFARNLDAQIERGGYFRGDLFLENIRRAVPAGGRVLDYGCGPGRIARLIAQAGYRVRGLDRSKGMIHEATRQDLSGLSIEFEVADDNGASLESESYEGAVCSSVIEYVDDAGGLLRNLHRALRPGGVLVVSYANRRSLWRKYSEMRFRASHEHFSLQHHIWNFADCRAALAEAGFEPAARARFFDSPFDARRGLSLLGSSELVGTLGLVTARRS